MLAPRCLSVPVEWAMLYRLTSRGGIAPPRSSSCQEPKPLRLIPFRGRLSANGSHAVAQDGVAVATSVLQRVRQDWRPVEGAFVVDALREREHRGRAPGGVDRRGAEGIAGNTPEQVGSEN